MDKISTQKKILQFVYDELGFDEVVSLSDEIQHNQILEEELQNIITEKDLLNRLNLQPSNGAINRVLEFSSSQNGIEA